ncbi:MAG TPA: cyclic nucleotide-binding domain-containing protein [Acidimicrobiia bacterium]|nr:cyclic nucleotide-binding domain-containing protein [Acidimicrobiia bacterium]
MSLETIDQLLRTHPFFKDLDPGYLELVAGCGKNMVFETGDYLCREGDPADLFFIVRRGRVAIEVHLPARGSLVIDTAGEADVVGASWLFPPYRWQFDARALEPVGVVALDGACLRDKCEEDTRLGYQLMKRFAEILVERLESARLRLIDLYGGGRAG